jgi:hypothetical protein
MAANSICSKSRRDDAIAGACFYSVDVSPITQFVDKTSSQLFVHFFSAGAADIDDSMSIAVVLKLAKTVEQFLRARRDASLLCSYFEVFRVHVSP